MAKRDFDFKQFMLQKGDRVGIGVAGGLSVLLLFGGVIMLFGKDTSLSPQKNADDLDKITLDREQKMVSNVPSEAKFQELRTISADIKDVKNLKPVPLDPYAPSFPFDFGPGAGDNIRRSPIVLHPAEFVVKVIHAQLSFYMFNADREQIGVLVDPPPSKKKQNDAKNPSPTGIGSTLSQMGGKGGMGYGPPAGGGKGPGGKGGGLGGPPGGMGMEGPGGIGGPGSGSKSDNKMLNWRKFSELKSSDVLAENLMPLRAAEIVGSFPLKKQLEEYQRALHVKTISELYDPAKPQFGFRGLKVQRRTLTTDGTPDSDGWRDLDLDATARWWALNNGRRSEPEDPEMMSLLQWSNRLYMDRPIQIEDASEKYPTVETQLTGIKKSLEELKNLGEKAAPPKNPYTGGDDITAFGGGDDDQPEKGTKAPVTPRTGDGDEMTKKGGSANVTQQAPEFALIRFFDTAIKPGETYEYQVKILLRNPNRDRDDVRKDLADAKELESEWVPVGHKLFVPEEIKYYAVDLRKDSKEGKRFVNLPLAKDNQAVLQIHRWVQDVVVRPGTPKYPAGEWAIAERVVIYKGENIGQTHKVKIPIWMFNQAAFVLATNTTAPAREKHLIDIPFDAGANDALLVDVTPDTATYKSPAKTKEDGTEIPPIEIKQAATAEVLLLTPEGKLLLRDYDADTSKETPEGKERVDRWDSWKERIKKVEEGGDKKPGNDIFNKGGGSGS